MNKHTPGPWTDKSIDESQWGIYDSRGWSVAQAHQIKVLSADLKQDERTANARLIAAAPDLLYALKLCASVCAGETMHKKGLIEALEAACAAIKKATAEEAPRPPFGGCTFDSDDRHGIVANAAASHAIDATPKQD